MGDSAMTTPEAIAAMREKLEAIGDADGRLLYKRDPDDYDKLLPCLRLEDQHAIKDAVRMLTQLSAALEMKLPCDVALPPATIIKAGCPLSALLLAMQADGRPAKFPKGGKTLWQRLSEASAALGKQGAGERS